MNYMGIIPARLQSTRLPNKPLQKLGDTPLCVYVADRLIETGVFDKVVVATDDAKVFDLFEDHKAEAVMTKPEHESGTDRIYEVIQKMGFDDGIVVNVQGDEPFVYKEDLKSLIQLMKVNVDMASAYEPLKEEDVFDKNKVKVLLNENQEALYFSRFGIPFSRVEMSSEALQNENEKRIGKHIGLYAYKASFLKKFCEHDIGYFERHEKLEQLRALEMGAKIKMFKTTNAYQGIDTKEDLNAVRKIIGVDEK